MTLIYHFPTLLFSKKGVYPYKLTGCPNWGGRQNLFRPVEYQGHNTIV